MKFLVTAERDWARFEQICPDDPTAKALADDLISQGWNDVTIEPFDIYAQPETLERLQNNVKNLEDFPDLTAEVMDSESELDVIKFKKHTLH